MNIKIIKGIFIGDYKFVSSQLLKIRYKRNLSSIPAVFIDNKSICIIELKKIAESAGFNNIDEFLNNYNTDFDGTILHFTNVRYAE